MNRAVNPNPAVLEPPLPNPGSLTLPYRRVGTLLRAARTQAGYSPRAVARATGFSKQLLAAWEHGEVGVGDDNLAKLAVLYQVSLESLAPARRGITIDRDTGTLRVGHHIEPLPKSITEPGEILERYLHLLYSLRGLKPNDQVHLRDDDLNNLADILGNTPREIERRLIDLMGISQKEATRLRRIILRRHVLTPAAGLALGAGLFGGFQALDNNAGSVENPPAIVQTTSAPETPGGETDSTIAADTPTTLPAPPDTGPTAPSTLIERGPKLPPFASPDASTTTPTASANSTPTTTVEPSSDAQPQTPEPFVLAPTPTTTADGPPIVVIDAPGPTQASRPE